MKESVSLDIALSDSSYSDRVLGKQIYRQSRRDSMKGQARKDRTSGLKAGDMGKGYMSGYTTSCVCQLCG